MSLAKQAVFIRRADKVSNAALRAWIDKDKDMLAYRLVPEQRVILFKHMDLGESWWKRGKSWDESRMQRIESLVQGVTGLQRLTRVHHESWDIVEFKLAAKHYEAAAVALRLTYRPDPDWERSFDRFLARNDPSKH